MTHDWRNLQENWESTRATCIYFRAAPMQRRGTHHGGAETRRRGRVNSRPLAFCVKQRALKKADRNSRDSCREGEGDRRCCVLLHAAGICLRPIAALPMRLFLLFLPYTARGNLRSATRVAHEKGRQVCVWPIPDFREPLLRVSAPPWWGSWMFAVRCLAVTRCPDSELKTGEICTKIGKLRLRCVMT